MRRRFLVAALALAAVAAAGELKVRVTLDASASEQPVSGRLLIILEPGSEPKERLEFGFIPGKSRLAAREVRNWKPGYPMEVTSADPGYPTSLAALPDGDYRVMAVLDPDHSFARDRQDPGDLYSKVVVTKAEGVVELQLTGVTPARKPLAESETLKVVEFESPLLSRFWGRPIVMRAGVVLPRDWQAAEAPPLPAVYHVHGFGGNHREAAQREKSLVEAMAAGQRLRAAHVFLDASFPTGHHVFADSVNNGPWGAALTRELIPHLEKRFRLVPAARGRFLTGHSSGGWSTLWLQVAYPDFFGGTWPTAPDSIDFRSFTGVSAVPGNIGNAYVDADGKQRNLVRMGGKELMSFREFSLAEVVAGEYGGQMASFDWVFSPRGRDGRPMPLYDRTTGELDPLVVAAWQRYDIGRILRERWAELGPKLRGKIHLTMGAEDNFHLEEASILVCDWLKERWGKSPCEIVPGRDHMNLYRPYDTYPDGLEKRIDDEMKAAWDQPR